MSGVIDDWDSVPVKAGAAPSSGGGITSDWDAVPVKETSKPQAQAKPASKPGLVDKIGSAVGESLGSTALGSTVLGAVKGGFDTLVDAPAQFVANTVADAYPKNLPGYDYFQKQKDIANQGVKDRAANFAEVTQDHPTAAYAGEVAGGIGGAVALPLGKVAEGANLVNKLIHAAKTGAAVGLSQPVQDSDNFWAEKAKQGAVGAVGGVVGYPVGAVAGKAIGAVGNKVANMTRPAFAGASPEVSAMVANASPELQQSIQQALKNGEKIDPKALARQVEADSLPVPMSLTKGQATQDPIAISTERNLRGKNPDMVYKLNDQNAQLSHNLEAISKNVAPDVKVPDNFVASQHLISAAENIDKGMKDNITGLYQKLRDANGGSLPMDGKAFAIESNKALGEEMRGAFLPTSIQGILEKLQTGERPMTFENFENLRSILGKESAKAARAGDGNTESAVNTVYKKLLNMPLTNETQEIKPLADAARAAAAQRFKMIDSVPAFKAIVNGNAAPDDFVKKYIVNGKTGDIAGFAQVLSNNPEALQTIKAATINHLRDSAVNQAGNFSQSAYNNAVDALAPKLKVLFGADELKQIQAVGNVARHIQAQPTGSFVNNSNTDVAAVARGAGNIAAHAVNAVTNSPLGSIASNAITSAVEKKANSATLQSILKTGAGTSSQGPTEEFMKKYLPNLSGKAGTVSLSSILSSGVSSKKDGKN